MIDEKYKKIFENNKKWVEDKTSSEKDFFSKHYKGQSPDYLYIGCSDSRVPANEITGLDVGEMFVHRNIANVVANNDVSLMSVIQYAVEVLEVKHIVVCGHYGCGGLKASLQPPLMGVLDSWLRNLRDVYRFHKMELDVLKDEDAKMDRFVELNVEEQCLNLIKNESIQKSFKDNNAPQIHGWVYDMRKGLIKDLNFNSDSLLKKAQEIFNW